MTKKVLIISTIDSFGGTRTYLDNLLKFYSGLGVEIIIGTESENNVKSLLKTLMIRGIQVIALPTRPLIVSNLTHYFHLFTAIYEITILRKIIKQYIPDLLVITPAGVGSFLSAICLPVKRLLIVHSYPERQLPLTYQSLLTINKANIKYVTVSDYSKNILKKFWKVDAKRIYNPPEALLINNNDCKDVILTTGHLEWYKQPLLWLEVIKRVYSIMPNFPFKFVWAGEGSLKQELEEKILMHGLTDKCKLLPPKNDISDLLSKTYIYIQPSLMESQGIAVTTAQNLGIPCVVSNAGGLPEVVLDGVTGYVIDKYDTEDFANKIITLTSNKNKVLSMGKMARKHIQDNFNYNDWVKQMYALHEGLI